MRDGRWYKIIYERDSAPVNIASDPYDVRNSQWLRRWKRSCENFANIYAHKDCFACGEIQFEFPKIDDPHGSGSLFVSDDYQVSFLGFKRFLFISTCW